MDGFAPVIVDVPIPPQPTDTPLTITNNGVTNSPAGVRHTPITVAIPPPVLVTKNITQNGEYTPAAGEDGFNKAIVNVPPTPPVIQAKNITQNGTYPAPAGVDGFAPVIVDVPQGAILTEEQKNDIKTLNGTIWRIRTSAANNNWYSVCYGNGLFVAVAISGSGNRVMTSPDGINWTICTSAADNQWRSVCYGNGLFVAVASSGTNNRVMTSYNFNDII